MTSPSHRRSVESFESVSSPLTTPRAQSVSPYPHHDWSQRAAVSNRYQPRRPSTASSISSIGGALDTSSQSRVGTVREYGQNAISTLLQPPIVRTGLLPHTSAPASAAHKPPSSRDIPPVSLTNIPHVEPPVFGPYLSQVGSLFDSFQRAKAEAESPASQVLRKGRDIAKKDEAEEILERGLRRESSSIGLGIRTLSPAQSPQVPRRRSSGGFPRRNIHATTPLSTIPSVYFEGNFHLENPRTFDIVSERSEVIRPPQPPGKDSGNGANGTVSSPASSGRKALATNAILQEKLSWYMDTVEVHLISSISTASTSFFAALGSLRELQSEAADSVAKIKALRNDLGRLDKEMAIGGLRIVEMKRRRGNLRKLAQATQQLHCVVGSVAHCEEFIDQGDLEVALDHLDGLESLISGTLDRFAQDTSWIQQDLPPTLIDLRNLKALDGLPEAMQQLRYRIGKGFETRFLEALLGDLRRHIKSFDSKETLQRWASAALRGRGDHGRKPSVFPSYLNMPPNLRKDLLAHLNGLSRSGYISQATNSFRDAVMREMKNLIRYHLPSSSDDDTESVTSVSTSARSGRPLSAEAKSSILARNLRSLDPEAAEELLVNVYTGVGEALRRLSIQIKLLLDVTSGVTSPPLSGGGIKSPPRSPNIGNMDGYLNRPAPEHLIPDSQLQDELMQALDMSSLLGQAVDVAQTQITKVLKVRSEQTVRLPLQRFLRYFQLNRFFADECEGVSGRSGTALKGVVNQHIADFVSMMGELEKQRLAQVMEADRWEARDFGDAENELLRRVLEGMTADPAPWLSSLKIWEYIEITNANGSAITHANGTGKEKARNAFIDEERFILVESAIAALRGVDKFENLIASIPSMTTEVSSALLDYLKLFNSRSCQLILGAGATRSAGLKNINTKHLALASQALSFLIAIIPYIREFIRRRSPSSTQSLAQFDQVKRLYQDHQVSIHDKLIDIMSGRATSHVNAMKKIDWDSAASQNVSPHMETLTKETSTLHRVLSKHLPEMQVQMIMVPVLESYREQWGKAFMEAQVGTSAGKARLLRDAELFNTKLSKIDGAGDIGPYIVSIAKEKSISSTPIEEQKSDNQPASNPSASAPEGTS